MGAIHFSIDPELVATLARHLPFEVFIETGTYKGESIDRVQPYFNRIYSIELSDHYVKLARSKFKDDPMVSILHGDSAVELKKLVPEIEAKSTLFWLDSHWCDDSETEGAASQCSLIKELGAISALNSASAILIDDARLFLSPPGEPHDYSQWPDINEILSAFHSLSDSHELMVFNDIIAYFPRKIKPNVKQYAHRFGVDWLHAMDALRQYDELIAQLKAKENEIEFIKRENTILTKESQIKENEINFIKMENAGLTKESQVKENEIELIKRENNNLTKEIEIKERELTHIRSLADHHLAAINQLDEARKAIICGYEGQIEQLKGIAGEAQSHLKTLKDLADEKEKYGNSMKDIAESRLKVIQDLDYAIKAYRNRHIRERVKRWLLPRIGVLYHYPPKPVKIPKSYMKYKDKPVDAQSLPLISMVTPSFNHADFIERTIVSVFEQEYPRLEYRVQDGGSADGTVDILKKYQGRLSRWESRKDNGQADAINLGFEGLNGDIMSYLNSDDLLLPGAIHYVARYFAVHPDVDVVYGHRVLIDEYDLEIGRWVLPPHDDEVLSWADFIPQETLFWRRSIWEKAGGYINDEFKFAMDWDLILRFRDAGAKFVRLPRFLGAFRVHPHQKTSKELAELGEKEMTRLRERVLGRKVSDAEIHLNLEKYMSRHILLHKLYRAGLLRY